MASGGIAFGYPSAIRERVNGPGDCRGGGDEVAAQWKCVHVRGRFQAWRFADPRTRVVAAIFALSLLMVVAIGCGAKRPSNVGLGKIAPCSGPPACFSSEASIGPKRIEPFVLTVSPAEAWAVVLEVVAAMPRTTIVAYNDRALHAEVRTPIFRFIDDLELRLRPEKGKIDVRASARVGVGDMGVNKRRINTLRSELGKSVV